MLILGVSQNYVIDRKTEILVNTAMQTKNGNIHLEIQTSRKNPVGIIRNTFWDKEKKAPRHTQLGRITGCTIEQLKMLQLAFREQVIAVDSPEPAKLVSSQELERDAQS